MVLIHISGPILYAKHLVQHKSAVLQAPIFFTWSTNMNLQHMPISSPVFAVSPMGSYHFFGTKLDPAQKVLASSSL